MKMLIASVALLTVLQFAKADTLAKWTFETSQPGGNQAASVWVTNLTAEIGAGTASGFHVGPAGYVGFLGNGNGSFFAFGATNGWAVGDFFQFAVSTTGYQNILISYDQAGTTRGPRNFFLEYSMDGNTFTKFGSDYAVGLGNWSSTVASTTNSFSFNLSSVAAINNQSTVYFRLVDDSTVAIGGGTVSGYEDDRIDNFLVSAQPVPEPSAMALALLGGAFSMFVLKRKRLKG
jgi:hypothetical protein